MKKNKKPSCFDRNLIVIGAGSAGLVAAYIAAITKAKTTLAEKHKMGGDCLNTGCIPSKAFIRSARFLAHIKQANKFGFRSASADYEFCDVMRHVQKIINTVAPKDSAKRYTELGVECLQGEANLLSPWEVEINGQTLRTRSVVIASGAHPLIPDIKGINRVNYLTSDTVWKLKKQPDRLLILGGGPIGCELAQSFARFGTKVTQVERLPNILSREDPEVANYMVKRFHHEGIDIRTAHVAKEIIVKNGNNFLLCLHDGNNVEIPFDDLLIAVGRKANVEGFGLEEIGIELTSRSTIKVNDYLQSSVANIFACGDVVGPYQFTHVAAYQAWYATVNALFGKLKKFRINYLSIPWTTFTDPEIARVGLNETEAKEKGIAYEVSTYDIGDLDRAITEGEPHGFIKVVTHRGKDRILGVTIVADHAGELINGYTSAIKYKHGLNKILATIQVYPTMSEANKFVAGVWKKNHTPEFIFSLMGKYHDWMRN